MTLLSVPPLDDEPWPTLGPQVCALIEERAVFGPGSLKGEPARLDAEKKAIIYRAYEVYPRGHRMAGRRRFQRVGISLPKGSSKALALDTRLPTPTGWTTMGAVRVGDQLLDERGKPCTVAATSPVFLGNQCFEVLFRCGARIVADADHRWLTQELRHRYEPSVKTTTELAQTVVLRADGARNHRIPVASPLDLPEADLQIDPWILGAWLGDGRTNDSEFTMHSGDHEHFVERVEAAGYHHRPPKVDSRNGVFAVRVSTAPITHRGPRGRDSLVARLRVAGLLGRKHIPMAYLRASCSQRLALLQGLMDTDGGIDANGVTYLFTSTVRELAAGTFELMCTLGIKPTMTEFVTAAGSQAWAIYFHVSSAVPVFSLPRKRARQLPAPTRTAMSSNRHIVAVTEVPTVPTKCVAVDSPAHLYLAGDAMVPTHNTELMAWIAFAELHPDGPVRFDGWDAAGNPVGRPVADPYIPLIGFSEEQTEELAYGALLVVCSEGPDSALFDIGLNRIIRLDDRGRADGKAQAIAAAPNSADGARTTYQGVDESHRLYLQRYLDAVQTMQANLTKRPLDDPWHMEVTTAGQLGQGSVAERTHKEAESIARGEYADPDLLYHHRQASETHDLGTREGRIAAVAEARGGVGEYAPGQFESIARQWERPNADRAYLERVWLNRWVRADAQAFDANLWKACRREERIQPGELVVAGFDGARFRDATAIVLTDVATGLQELHSIWERPLDLPETAEWEVPEVEVSAAWEEIRSRFQLWKTYGDPPHWTESFGSWSARWPDTFEEWWTNRPRPMAHAIREFSEAMASQQVTWSAGSPLGEVLSRHVAGAGRKLVNLWDDAGKQLFILQKLHPDRKFDACMAAVLSWQARLEAVRQGAKKRGAAIPRRIR